MPLTNSSVAAAVGSSVKNTSFKPSASNLARKILIVGTANPSLEAGLTLETPILVTSPEDVASRVGSGYMLHRLAKAAFRGSSGIETYILIQAEDGAAAQASGNVVFTGPATEAGTVYLYIAGEAVEFTIANAATATEIAAAAVAAVNADSDLPVTAAVNGVDDTQMDITAKSGGPYGNEIDISFNLGFGQELPAGVGTTVTGMSGGSGLPDISAALDALGTGDGANEDHYTALIHGYGQDSTTLDAIADYVGQGNDFTGLYKKTVARPFRSLVGDVASGSGGLSALVSLADGRKEDRAQGVIAVPGSETPESEIASEALGNMERISQTRAEQNYLDVLLTGVQPGASKGDRWTNDYSNRDTAARGGISTTLVKSGSVYMQDTLTFYRPDDVPLQNNGYRSQRNIAILQNILYNIKLNFESEKWKGVSIVSDVSNVTSAIDRLKARDIQSVVNDLVSLAQSFESLAWIFQADFTIDNLTVELRDPPNGFNNIFPVILSGEGGIVDTITQFDVSTAILN